VVLAVCPPPSVAVATTVQGSAVPGAVNQPLLVIVPQLAAQVAALLAVN
jgi:hypothetical protein